MTSRCRSSAGECALSSRRAATPSSPRQVAAVTAPLIADETPCGVARTRNALSGQLPLQSASGPAAGNLSTSGSATIQSTAVVTPNQPTNRRSSAEDRRACGEEKKTKARQKTNAAKAVRPIVCARLLSEADRETIEYDRPTATR